MIVIDFTDPANTGGSWLRRYVVRCAGCRRLYTSIALVTAKCPHCGQPGPWVETTTK